MSNAVLTNIFRFILLWLMQVFVFKQVTLEHEYLRVFLVFIYPLFILLLPFRTPRYWVIVLGFVMGLAVDIFYDSPGIHASALTFMAFLRDWVFRWLEPKGGYNMNFSPTKERMGLSWFFQYSSILLAVHLFFYFSVEAFTFVYIVDIVQKTIGSFIVSLAIIMIIQFIFNPLD